jgi:hypothetical protein
VFNEEEEQQIQSVLSLSAADVRTIVEFSIFIFEKAAYYSLRGEDLATHLSAAGLKSDLVPPPLPSLPPNTP